MVSQYRKTPLFCCCKNHVFLGTRDFSKSRPIWTFTAKKKGGYARSRTTERIDTWELIFWNVGVKIRRNRATCFFFGPDTPDRPFWTPFLAWKSAKPAFGRTWKGSKTVKNRVFGHLMHSIASPSPVLRYRIQLWGHWHHYNGFPISKKPTFFFFLQKSRFFGHSRFF